MDFLYKLRRIDFWECRQDEEVGPDSTFYCWSQGSQEVRDQVITISVSETRSF